MRNFYDQAGEIAESSSTLTLVGEDGAEVISWSEVLRRAELVGARFQQNGLKPQDLVIIAGRTSLNLIVSIIAAWMCGITVSVAPVPLRARKTAMTAGRFASMMATLSPSLVIGDGPILSQLMPGSDHDRHRVIEVGALDQWQTSMGRPFDRSSCPTDDVLATIQMTSGTTSESRGVKVPLSRMNANHSAIISRIGLASDDVVLSWLPLSHDMGLIGLFATPMVNGTNLVIMDPSLFASQPSNWMRMCSRYHATVTGGPNFRMRSRHVCLPLMNP